ncbi:MAG: glycosyltransferase family 39 protein [Flavobacteriaceae bacterium]|nr:glycosyltransferase family 39 protein [Flavobacteriaceae bacterium]
MTNLLINRYFILIVLSVVFLSSLIGLGSWGLTETSESRYAQIGKEMAISGDYLNPTLLGVYHYHKPPLTYQITALGYKLFGFNEFGARFFMQLALIIQLILVFKIARLLLYDREKAMLASLIYFSIPLVLISVRNLTTDAYLNTTVLFSIFFWLRLKHSKNIVWLYLFYASLGIIMNIKGPVGLLFPIIFLVSHAIIFKIKIKFSFHSVLGLLIFLGLSAAWVLILIKDHPNMLEYFLDEQILRRIKSKSYNRSKPFWFYLVLLPLSILPWLWPLIKSAFNKSRPKADKTRSLLVINLLLIVLIFSLFSTKLILYILPVSLCVSLLAVKSIDEMTAAESRLNSIILSSLSIIPVLVLMILPIIDSKYSLNYWLVWALLIGTAISIYLIQNKSTDKTLRFGGLSIIFGLVMLFGSTLFFQKNDLYINSIKRVTSFIESRDDLRHRPVIVHNYLLPSASFYLNKPITTLNFGHNTVQRDTRFQGDDNWEKYMVDIQNENELKTLDSLLNEPVVLLVRRRGDNIESLRLFENRGLQMVDFDKWLVFY